MGGATQAYWQHALPADEACTQVRMSVWCLFIYEGLSIDEGCTQVRTNLTFRLLVVTSMPVSPPITRVCVMFNKIWGVINIWGLHTGTNQLDILAASSCQYARVARPKTHGCVMFIKIWGVINLWGLNTGTNQLDISAHYPNARRLWRCAEGVGGGRWSMGARGTWQQSRYLQKMLIVRVENARW